MCDLYLEPGSLGEWCTTVSIWCVRVYKYDLYLSRVCAYGLYLYFVCINIVCESICVYLWCVPAYGVNLYGVCLYGVCVSLCVNVCGGGR